VLNRKFSPSKSRTNHSRDVIGHLKKNMKTTLTILITIMTITFSFGQKFSLGSEVGIISSISTKYNITDFKNRRNTYYNGLNLNYHFNDRLSFTTGFHYLRQGYRHSTCYTFKEGVKNELVGKIDYLTIPISANIHLLKSKKLMATFGLVGGYNIKAAQDYPRAIGGCKIYYISDLAPSTKKYSISGIVGIGYKILENDKFELISNVKYYQGFSNSYNNPNSDTEVRMGGVYLKIDRKHSSAVMTMNFNFKI
jgi:Outer membrane protein beta-barrel domain